MGFPAAAESVDPKARLRRLVDTEVPSFESQISRVPLTPCGQIIVYTEYDNDIVNVHDDVIACVRFLRRHVREPALFVATSEPSSGA